MNNYPKVTKVSFSVVDDEKKEKISERFVEKSEFNDFVLTTDDIPPLVEEEAIIEIIAPVLKNENHRWLGQYNGKSVPFNMKSGEFKTLVQNGKVEFKNGSSIVCHLEIKRKVNNEGVVLNVGYDVIRVNYYSQNDRPLETKEGKKHRQVKEAQKAQLELFNQAE